MTVFRDITFLAAGPASERSRSAEKVVSSTPNSEASMRPCYRIYLVALALPLALPFAWLSSAPAPLPKPARPALEGPEDALQAFLGALAKKDLTRAHGLVAPSTKEGGDPIAYRAKVDYDTFAAEAAGQPAGKFGAYRLGKRREEARGRVRIWVHFECGDNDETLLVREGGRWYVADPIHIIR
jgi:hypothetical protein